MARKKRRSPITKAALKAKATRTRQAMARKAWKARAEQVQAWAERVAEAKYAEQVRQLRVTREQVQQWVREEMQHLAFAERAKVERWAAFVRASADTKAGQLIEGQKFTPRGAAVIQKPDAAKSAPRVYTVTPNPVDWSVWEMIHGQT